jgi:hypothetical protein
VTGHQAASGFGLGPAPGRRRRAPHHDPHARRRALRPAAERRIVAGDIKYAIERLFTKPVAFPFARGAYGDLAGLDEFVAGRRTQHARARRVAHRGERKGAIEAADRARAFADVNRILLDRLPAVPLIWSGRRPQIEAWARLGTRLVAGARRR